MLDRIHLQLRKSIPPAFGRIDSGVIQSVPLLAAGGGLIVAFLAATVSAATSTAGHTAKPGLRGLSALGGRTKPKRTRLDPVHETQKNKLNLHPVRSTHALDAISTHPTALDNLSPGAADDAGLAGLLGRMTAGAGRSPALLLLVLLVIFLTFWLGGLRDSLRVLLLLKGKKANGQYFTAKLKGKQVKHTYL